MLPVEVKIIGKDNNGIIEFRSLRAAFEFIEDSIESDKTLHMIHSRVHVGNRLTNKWSLAAADASRHKLYLIRLKPPT